MASVIDVQISGYSAAQLVEHKPVYLVQLPTDPDLAVPISIKMHRPNHARSLKPEINHHQPCVDCLNGVPAHTRSYPRLWRR